jgi:outer membrane cobalamin receptor
MKFLFIVIVLAGLFPVGLYGQKLEENAVTLEEVTIYGKSQVQRIREGSLTVNALKITEALQNTSAGLNNIIGRTTSVHIREEGGVGSDFDLSINGMSGNSVRYFLDGMPLDTKGSGVSLANLPVNIIDRIEIYKGVIPASLGTDALGGAINIITKQERKNYIDASYSIGSFHTHKADLNAQFVESKTGLIIKPVIGVNYSKNDYTMKGVEVWDESADAYVSANRKRFHDDYFSFLGQLEIGYINKPWADAFFVSVSYSETNKELQTGSVQSRVYGVAERESDAWNISAHYKKRNFILKDMLLNASLSHTWDHSLTVDTAYRKYDWNGDYIVSSRNEITGRGRSMRHYKRPLTIIRTNLDYELNNCHSLNLNYQMNRVGNDRYDDVDTQFEASNDVVTKHILGLSYRQSLFNEKMENIFFIKDYINRPSIRQTDIPSVTGSRDVQGSTTKNYFGYGVGLRYTIMELLSLKVSYEHSVRLPLARELLGNGTTIYANVALKPENSNNANVSLFGTWYQSGHTIYYEAGCFLRNVDNYIQANISENEGMMQYVNVPAVHIKGVEGEVRYDWQNKLQLSANLSYQDTRNQQKYKSDGKPSAIYNNRVPNRPWLFGNAEAGYTFRNIILPGSKLRLGCTYQWVHWYFLTWEAYGTRENKARIPTQHICNADVAYSWKDGRYNIALECSNFLDKLAYDNYKLQKPGRAFFAKFRLFIN